MSFIVGIIIYLLFAYLFYFLLKKKIRFKDRKQAHWLLYFHLLLAIVYFLYAYFTTSDSKEYFNQTSLSDSWISNLETGTPFIHFLAYPFVKYLAFNYEACMGLFAALGYAGFLFFFMLYRHFIKQKLFWNGSDLGVLIFFLPNLHFWSSSLGKGSVIFLGIAMLFYALTALGKHLLLLFFGFFLVYYIRPHIGIIILMSSVLAFLFSNRGVKRSYKILVLLLAGIAFYFLYEDVMKYTGIEDAESATKRFEKLSKDLSKAKSGIDLSNYSLPEKLFALLYRPLFFDSPNALGLFSSIENLFYLVLTFSFILRGGLRYIFNADAITKTAFLSFLISALALAQITGNLGIAMRQKSQVMLLFLFVVCHFFYQQKMQQMKRRKIAVNVKV